MQQPVIPKSSDQKRHSQTLNLPLRVAKGNKFEIKSSLSSFLSSKKVQAYLTKLVTAAEVLSGTELNDLFEKIISYNELGEMAFGFRWGSIDPNDPNAKAIGTEENKRNLLGNLVESAMVIVRTKKVEMNENQAKRYIAVVVVLQGLADLTSIVNTCFFFVLGKSWAGWTFVVTTVLARLYHCLTVYLFETKRPIRSYIGSLLGIKVFSDAYYASMYSADARSFGLRLTSRYLRTIGRAGTALLQLTPQVIVSFYVFFDMLKSKSTETGLLWMQMITISSACLSLGIEMATLDYEKNKNFASEDFYVSMSCFMPSDQDPAFQKVMFSVMILRYTMHYVMVCMGLGVLTLETSVAVCLSVVLCFLLVVNVLRYAVNGSSGFFLRSRKTIFTQFCARVGPTLLYGVAAGLMPLSWKETVAKEFLNDHFVGSMLWDERTLLGDEDAHYAALIAMYCDDDLPWRELEEWLRGKKATFANSPPVWMSEQWILMIPKETRQSVWNADEFSDLLDAVRKAEKRFAQGLIRNTNLSKAKPKKSEKNVEKSIDQMEHSCDEDSSSKEKTKIMSKRAIESGETDTPNSELVMLKGKLVDRNLNPERQMNEGGERHSGEKQKEKTPNVDNQSSRNEAANEADTTFAIHTGDSALRQQAENAIQRSRSSLATLNHAFARPTQPNELLKTMNVPEQLTQILSNAVLMKLKDIRVAVEDSLDKGGLVKSLIEDGDESKILSIVLCAVLRSIRKMGEEDKSSVGVLRTAIAGFFEVADEVSDIVLAGLFYAESGDVLWAAHLMFVFMGLNRFMQCITSLALGQSVLSAIEGLVGVKSITDTYRLISHGFTASKGGRLLSQLRGISLIIGIIFESFPQMMLQVVMVLSLFSKKNTEVNAGMLIAQLASVTMSSASIGLSMASLVVDTAMANTIPGKERHIRGYKFVPRNNVFRQMILLLSLTVVTTLHVILAVFGFGALFASAPTALSVSITIGNVLIISCLRYWAHDVGIYGLDLCSGDWGIPDLVGDRDANHAAHIKNYRSCYQPWDKIEDWLNDKK
eukprot:g283.t1